MIESLQALASVLAILLVAGGLFLRLVVGFVAQRSETEIRLAAENLSLRDRIDRQYERIDFIQRGGAFSPQAQGQRVLINEDERAALQKLHSLG
jgi:hypothetical protein